VSDEAILIGQFVVRYAILTGARQDAGLVQKAPRRRSLPGCAGGLAAVAPMLPRGEISRPLELRRLIISASVPSVCHSSKRRLHVAGDG
jgi:hypothetical protein